MKWILTMTISTILLTLPGVQSRDVSAGYRGIVPLKSTRPDVERMLGVPVDASNPSYRLADKTVSIEYSKYGCTPPPRVEGWPAPPVEGWNVPPDTVLVVRVTMRKQVTLKSLKLDLKRFTKERGDSDVPSSLRYVDHEKGLTIELNGDPKNETVRALIYEPEAKYNHLRCLEQKTVP